MKRILLAFVFLIILAPAEAAVSLHAASQSFEVGSPSFLHCFFSTVSANLEPAGWGTRFPVLMNKLYQGNVSVKDLPELRKEQNTVHKELNKYLPSKVVWDIENRDLKPPWGDNISKHITDLSNYFVTSDGKDLFNVLFKSIKVAEHSKVPLRIE